MVGEKNSRKRSARTKMLSIWRGGYSLHPIPPSPQSKQAQAMRILWKLNARKKLGLHILETEASEEMAHAVEKKATLIEKQHVATFQVDCERQIKILQRLNPFLGYTELQKCFVPGIHHETGKWIALLARIPLPKNK